MRIAVNKLNILIVIAVLSVLVGCSKTTGRQVNVSEGEYYTSAQFDSLSNGDRQKYCSALEAERDRLRAQVDSTQKDVQATRKNIESLRGQISPTEKEILKLESEIRTIGAFRKESFFSDLAIGVISGLGAAGYESAVRYALNNKN